MNIEKQIPKLIFTFFGLLIILPVLAPIFLYIGWIKAAEVIYTAFVPFCHQKASRSLHLFDYQFAVCTRDWFMYFGLFSSALGAYLFKLKKLNWKFVLASLVPIALDGGIQVITQIAAIRAGDPTSYLESTNLRRMITGFIFGTGVGLFIFPPLYDDLKIKVIAKFKRASKLFRKKIYLYVIPLFLVALMLYGVVGFFWNMTSDKYKPSGIFDNVHRIPGKNYELEGRGDHARFLINRGK